MLLTMGGIHTPEITVGIVGSSGYTGGELLRLCLFHPNVKVCQITSETFFGKYASSVHPNLRKHTDLKFTSIDNLELCDILFLCLPHGQSFNKLDFFRQKAKKIIDLSSDYRLKEGFIYEKWYHKPHPNPNILSQFVYGLPEIHREEIKVSSLISSGGCNATASILGLYPLFKHKINRSNEVFIEVKAGSSEIGKDFSLASHHPERSGVIRSYKPVGHRHTAEIIQELSIHNKVAVHFSATSVELVRGLLATCHLFIRDGITEKDIWRIYRQEYNNEPFIRIIKSREGIYRYPEPKILAGTNYCDIGFELDSESSRLVVITAIDNLVKGAAGQALQSLNIMQGFQETLGLEFCGLHPI